jgi:hypothetical protein
MTTGNEAAAVFAVVNFQELQKLFLKTKAMTSALQ